MKLNDKVRYTANHIDSIARHDSAEVDDVLAALDRVIQYAQAAKATAAARERRPAKVAIATDEAAIREKIANVRKVIENTTDPELLRHLRDVESTFGAMLPPVTGTLVQPVKPEIDVKGGA